MKGKTTKMSEQVILREFKKSDRPALENVVREAWKYDRFCSPKTAAKMAKVYLNSCLTNQTFTQSGRGRRCTRWNYHGKRHSEP